MQRGNDFAGVLRLLRSVYPQVCTLIQFMPTFPVVHGSATIQRSDDGEHYRTFVSQLLVCIPGEAWPPPHSAKIQQLSSQREVVARVIQRICEKQRSNVLAFGFALVDENSPMPLTFAPNICNFLPNPTTATISTSVLWGTLLSRIGDDIMMYLLEHCSLFMLVPPTCCYQICGLPVYKLLNNVCRSPAWTRQIGSRQRGNILLMYIQKKFHQHKRYLEKATFWKAKRRLQANSSVFSVQRSSQTQHCTGNCQNGKTQLVLVEPHPSPGKSHAMQQHVTDNHLKRKSTLRPATTHENEDEAGVPAKRMRRDFIGTQAQSFCSLVNKSVPNLKTICDRCGWKSMVDLATPTEIQAVKPDVGSRLQNKVDIPVCEDSLSPASPFEANRRETHVVEENSEKFGNVLHLPKIRNNVTTECITLQEKAYSVKCCKDQLFREEIKEAKNNWQEAKPTKSVSKQPTQILPSNIIIERGYLLYSNFSFREGFSVSFLLNTLKQCPFGGQRLVENIFLSRGPFEHHPVNKPATTSKKWKRLPKRYWPMKCVFQELVDNHNKCPYKVLLRNNCPVRLPQVSLESNASLEKSVCGVPGPPHVDRGKAPNVQENTDERERSESTTLSGCKMEVAYEFSQVEAKHSSNTLVSTVTFKEAQSSQPGKEATAQQFRDSSFMKLLRQYSSLWQVYAFARECLKTVVPKELWGSNHNKYRFFKNVKTFISLGKFGKFSLRELMWKMRVTDCAWLRLGKDDHFVPASEHRFREVIFAKFLYWLMDTYVIQLLRSFFYITETMFQKNALFFYRKCIWSKLHKIGLGKHFAKVKLRSLSSRDVAALKQNPLISRLRFIPKPNGLRPIVKVQNVLDVQLHSKEKRDRKMQYFNTQLKNLFGVLNYERTRNPNLLGASVFGLDGIYKAWRQFVLKVLESNSKEKQYYFVKTDVTGAYDTIPHAKLIEVVSKILNPSDNYCIRRYAEIWVDPAGHIRKSYKRHVATMDDFLPNTKMFVSHLQQNGSLKHAILVEQALHLNENSRNLLQFFQQMITNNILKVGDKCFVQCRGIPQGSILSTVLCSLCYGDMENNFFSGIQQDGVFMRLIDDFLLVTPYLDKAETFLRTLAEGIPQYGCSISLSKTMVNFPLTDLPGCSQAEQLPARSVFPWCGVLFDTQTLEVYCDYSRYACTSIRSSLTISHKAETGTSMRHKLIRVLKLKCKSIFLDLMVNSLRTVFINIYKIFLLQAYRFHACVIQLPFNQGVRKNPSFFLSVISDMAPCCYSILKSKNIGIALGTKDACNTFPFEAAQWLSYHAFIVKLTCHKAVYKCLLKPLQNCKVQLSKKIHKATIKMLNDVIEPSLHKDFAAILN
ncbi:telomerase reverse transcriptase [Ambystoma mexicanum]|uniref:telomerase reverse transcriptase n=1 Tax=Ambystoma mexicanum TaxID=8296 RepID=UPI0037E90725